MGHVLLRFRGQQRFIKVFCSLTYSCCCCRSQLRAFGFRNARALESVGWCRSVPWCLVRRYFRSGNYDQMLWCAHLQSARMCRSASCATTWAQSWSPQKFGWLFQDVSIQVCVVPIPTWIPFNKDVWGELRRPNTMCHQLGTSHLANLTRLKCKRRESSSSPRLGNFATAVAWGLAKSGFGLDICGMLPCAKRGTPAMKKSTMCVMASHHILYHLVVE